MATKKKMLQAAAGSATGGGPLDITDVFSTYLYEGTGSAQTITNGIDLDGEGGLVWIKARETGYPHLLFDTERGANKFIYSNLTDSEQSYNGTLTSFNSNGFTIGTNPNVYNISGEDTASWTFRKAPKFFDVVTYTGNGTSSGIHYIDHSLGVTPAMIIVKKLSASDDWYVWHKDFSNGNDNYLRLNLTNSLNSMSGFWGYGGHTDTQFLVYNGANDSGETYVAYIFAHNDGDGEFGPDGDADVIKCGSYTGNGSTDGPVIDLGFEPQWFMWKRTDSTANWQIIDNMRGISFSDPGDPTLTPNTSGADNPDNNFNLTATGLKCHSNNTTYNASGGTYIYVAIRRGPLAPPESATEVFDVRTYTGNNINPRKITTSLSQTDFVIARDQYDSGNRNTVVYDRLRGSGGSIQTSTTNAETFPSGSGYDVMFDTNDGFLVGTPWNAYLNYSGYNVLANSWKRAPNFFDVVAYTGDGTGDRKLLHNLGVTPEMVWLKPRSTGDSYSGNWFMWHNTFGHSQTGAHLHLNTTDSLSSSTGANPVHSFDADGISPNIRGGGAGEHNKTGVDYIAYLFASLDGISKVGSYTGSGSSQTIDCGFTSGARFVLIKRTDSSGHWYVFDSERGITVGSTDTHLRLNVTDNEYDEAGWNGVDMIQPDNSGFVVTAASPSLNTSGASYIFYAIA